MLAALPVLLLIAQTVQRSEFASKLEPCRVPGFDGQAFCGHFNRPESPGSQNGRTIALNVVVLPATSGRGAPDPLVFLAGGGVVPATRYAGFLARAFPNLRRERDILLVDQRGTWGSNPLSCEDAPRPMLDLAAVAAAARACRDSLAAKTDLRAYGTPIAMDDLDAVRAWLGYTQVNIYGVSYGTKAAQVYLRTHPHRVRAMVLYGVIPLAAATQLDLAASSQASLDAVFDRCANDPECHAAFPEPGNELHEVLERLSASPASLSITAADDTQRPVTVGDRAVRNLIQEMLGSARGIERVPLVIHQLYNQDYRALLQPVGRDPGAAPPPGPPRGVFLSILCGEAIPQIDPRRIESATRTSFFGDYPVRSQIQQCSDWPRATLPRGFWQPVRAETPVLAISGDLDPIAPPRYGEMVAKALPNARHIVLKNRSHNDVDPCITGLFEKFLMNGTAAGLDTSCASTPPPLRFATPPASGSSVIDPQ